MMKNAFFILISFFALAAYGQNAPLPTNYSIVDTITGDLDNDGIMELVAAYNTKQGDEFESIPRELIIYKLENGKWKEWKKSSQALLESRDGGVMGDPYEQMKIEKGILFISHFGGSSWKWGYTDKYRYQDEEFYLIGYSGIGGKLCEYWKEIDYNLSTGKLIVKKEYEDCDLEEPEIYKRENETLYKKGLKVTIEARQEIEIKIVTPKYGHEFYISKGNS